MRRGGVWLNEGGMESCGRGGCMRGVGGVVCGGGCMRGVGVRYVEVAV